MTQLLPTTEPERTEFLGQHGLTSDDLAKSGLAWDLLEAICANHYSRTKDLESLAAYITSRLQTISEVHSLKARIKNPGHLAAKLIRKKMEKENVVFDLANYDQQITDLIGIRALHLFKDEWMPIHEFVKSEWDLEETPIAYVRKGDAATLVEAFEKAECEVREHKFGYRSIHYLVKCKPAKRVCVAELQIRTIFEEGWSEIDHRVRYPLLSDDPSLAQFLRIFNGLAGSADEMGTFVRGLSGLVHQHAAQVTEKEQQMAQLEAQLKTTISKLEISKKDKESLEKQVSELRKHSHQSPSLGIGGAVLAPGLVGGMIGSSAYFNSVTKKPTFAATCFGLTDEYTCSKCGKQFQESMLSMIGLFNRLCPDCRKSNVGGLVL